MRILKKRYKSETGGTLVESMFCMLIICLIFFGLLQIFHWSVAKILCEYSSFYAAKGEALGYKWDLVRQGARVAMMGASGEDLSTNPVRVPYHKYALAEQADAAMNMGNSGVDFEYWNENITSSSNKPQISIRTEPIEGGEFSEASVSVRRMPLLNEYLGIFVSLKWDNDNPPVVNIPAGQAFMYNHSQNYLDE